MGREAQDAVRAAAASEGISASEWVRRACAEKLAHVAEVRPIFRRPAKGQL
jgi:hypothetical protein